MVLIFLWKKLICESRKYHWAWSLLNIVKYSRCVGWNLGSRHFLLNGMDFKCLRNGSASVSKMQRIGSRSLHFMWTMVFYCQSTFVEYKATKGSREGGVVAAGSDDTWEMLKLQSLWAAPLPSSLVHHPRKSAKAYLYLMHFSPVCNLQEHEVVRKRELERVFCRVRVWEGFCFSMFGLYKQGVTKSSSESQRIPHSCLGLLTYKRDINGFVQPSVWCLGGKSDSKVI